MTGRIRQQQRRIRKRPLWLVLSWACCLQGPNRNIVMVANATIPPTNPDDHETVMEYRRRMGIQYDYDTKWLSPELCRTLSPQECQAWDDQFGKTIQINRQWLTPQSRKRQRRRRLKKQTHQQGQQQQRQRIVQTMDDNNNNEEEAVVGTEEEATYTNNDDIEQDSGGIKVLVLLLQWANHPHRLLIPPMHIEQLFNSDETNEELFPTGSVKRYYEVNSYGQFSISADVVPWIMTGDNHKEANYAASSGEPGLGLGLQNAIVPLLSELDNASSEPTSRGFDFSPYDGNGDGVIDLVVVLHSGYNAELGGEDCETLADASQRIGSHAGTAMMDAGDTMSWQSIQGYELGAYVVTSAFRGTCGSNIARLGTIVHEMAHTFGLPDLYDLDGPMHPTGNVGGLGNYDVMSNPNGQMNSQARPGHFSAWSKIQLGWIQPMEITGPGEFQLRPVERFPDVYRVSLNFQPGEFLLLENRQAIPGDFDERFWAPGGVVIYHVNEHNIGFGKSHRGGPFQKDWPLNGNHYGVCVLQRDGQYEIEQALNGGSNRDFFFLANHTLGPGNGEPVADSGDYSNTDSYAFGVVQTTGLTFRGFELVSEDGTMSFQVETTQIVIESEVPTVSPSISSMPTETESAAPSNLPSVSSMPTETASGEPSTSMEPSIPTEPPTQLPTTETVEPTLAPSPLPSIATEIPTGEPTGEPTMSPTVPEGMTDSPSGTPTMGPTMPEGMTRAPTSMPSTMPSMPEGMTASPTTGPSPTPTMRVTDSPTSTPSFAPTMREDMTATPTSASSSAPTMPEGMTASPTSGPSAAPTMPEGMTESPTSGPSAAPTVPDVMTASPTSGPTSSPTMPEGMTAAPTIATPPPTKAPTRAPQTPSPNLQTPRPVMSSTKQPTRAPSAQIPPISRPTIQRPRPVHPEVGKGRGKGREPSRGKGKGNGRGKGNGKGRKKSRGKGRGKGKGKDQKSSKGKGKGRGKGPNSGRGRGNGTPPRESNGKDGKGSSETRYSWGYRSSEGEAQKGYERTYRNYDTVDAVSSSPRPSPFPRSGPIPEPVDRIVSRERVVPTRRRRRGPDFAKARAKWRVLESGTAVVEKTKKFKSLSRKRRRRGE